MNKTKSYPSPITTITTPHERYDTINGGFSPEQQKANLKAIQQGSLPSGALTQRVNTYNPSENGFMDLLQIQQGPEYRKYMKEAIEMIEKTPALFVTCYKNTDNRAAIGIGAGVTETAFLKYMTDFMDKKDLPRQPYAKGYYTGIDISGLAAAQGSREVTEHLSRAFGRNETRCVGTVQNWWDDERPFLHDKTSVYHQMYGGTFGNIPRFGRMSRNDFAKEKLNPLGDSYFEIMIFKTIDGADQQTETLKRYGADIDGNEVEFKNHANQIFNFLACNGITKAQRESMKFQVQFDPTINEDGEQRCSLGFFCTEDIIIDDVCYFEQGKFYSMLDTPRLDPKVVIQDMAGHDHELIYRQEGEYRSRLLFEVRGLEKNGSLWKQGVNRIGRSLKKVMRHPGSPLIITFAFALLVFNYIERYRQQQESETIVNSISPELKDTNFLDPDIEKKIYEMYPSINKENARKTFFSEVHSMQDLLNTAYGRQDSIFLTTYFRQTIENVIAKNLINTYEHMETSLDESLHGNRAMYKNIISDSEMKKLMKKYAISGAPYEYIFNKYPGIAENTLKTYITDIQDIHEAQCIEKLGFHTGLHYIYDLEVYLIEGNYYLASYSKVNSINKEDASAAGFLNDLHSIQEFIKKS